jgi:WD40 repeat protein
MKSWNSINEDITSIRWHLDGKTIISGSNNGIIKLWSIKGNNMITVRGH